MKDHEIAALVNQVRDIAVEYAGTQQLRARISEVLVPALKGPQRWDRYGPLELTFDPERHQGEVWRLSDGLRHAAGVNPNDAINRFIQCHCVVRPTAPGWDIVAGSPRGEETLEQFAERVGFYRYRL